MAELERAAAFDKPPEDLAMGDAPQAEDEKEAKQLNTSLLPFEENYMGDQELQAVSILDGNQTVQDKESDDENELEQQDISTVDLEQATQDSENNEVYEEEQPVDSLLELEEATQEGENYDDTEVEQQKVPESEQVTENDENINENEEVHQDGEFIESDQAKKEGKNKDEIEEEQQDIKFIESDQATEECENNDNIEEEQQDTEVLESDQATQDGENVQTNLETENGDSDEIQQDSLLSDSKQTLQGKDSTEEIDKPKDISSLASEQPLQGEEGDNIQVQSEQALQADKNMENTKEVDSLDSINEAQFEKNTQNEKEQSEQDIPESEQTILSEKNKDLNEEDQQEVSVLASEETQMQTTESNENQDDDDIEEVDVTFCKVCNMHFDKEEKYYSHVRGLLHAHQQMAYEKAQIEKAAADSQESVDKLATSGSTEVGGDITDVGDSTVAGIEGEQDPALVPEGKNPVAEEDQGTEFISNEQEEEEYNEEYWEEDDLDYDESSHCELCDLTTTGPVSLRAHLLGRNHKLVQEAIDTGTPVPRRLLSKLGPNSKAFSTKTSMVVNVLDPDGPSVLEETITSVPEAIVGMWLVKEFTVGKQRSFLCTVCNSQCDLSAIQKHLIGSKHRMRYLRDYHPNVYAHIKSHGGRKSQLTAFLEEVCSDIESEMGRGAPVLKKPSEEDKSKKKGGDLDIDMPLGGQFGQAAQNTVPESFTKKLPHEVIMKKYKEMKRRKEIVGSHLPHFGDVNKPKFGRPNQGQNLYAIPPPFLLQGPPPMWNRPFSVPPPFTDNRFQRFPPPGGIFPLPGAVFPPPGQIFPPPMTRFPPPMTSFPPPANTKNNESQSFEINRPVGLSQDDEWEKMYQEYQEKIRLSMSSHRKRKSRSRSSSFSSGSFSSGSSRGRRSTSRSKQFSSKFKSWSKRSRSREYRSRYSRSRSRDRFLKRREKQRQGEMDKQGDRSRFSRKILQSSRYLDKPRSRSRDYQSGLRSRDRLAQSRKERLLERHHRSRSRDIERSQSRDRKRRRSSGLKNWSPVTHQDKKRLLELARQQMSPSLSLSPRYPSDSPKYSFSDTSEPPEYSPRDVRQGMHHHSNREPDSTASSSQMEELKQLRMSQKLISLGNQEMPSRYSRNRSESDMDLEDETVDVTPETIRAQALKSGVNDLLENLTDNLISTEDDASMALEVSKALTQALLRYRVAAHATSKPGEASTSSQSQAQNYDTRPIYGKKPEQPQTYGKRPEPSSTYGNRPEQPSLYGMISEQQPFYGRVTQTQQNLGKIPQQSQFYGNSGPPPFYGKMPEQQPYRGKRPEPPLNYGNRSTQSNSSQAESRKIYEQPWIKSKWD